MGLQTTSGADKTKRPAATLVLKPNFGTFVVPMERWKKTLYILWGAQFLAMVGMNLVVPFLPFFIRELGVTNEQDLASWSGIVFAGPFMTSVIATPFWGAMGDRYGRRLMVIRAIFGLAASQVLIGFSTSVVQLLLFRIVQGAISGFIAAALALISTTTPKAKIGYALGILQSATAAGTVLGPALGGVLADVIAYRQIFFITAGLCAVAGLAIMRFVREEQTDPSSGPPSTILQNISLMFKHPQLRIIAVTIFLGQGAALMIEPIFALFVERMQTSTQYVSTLTGLTIAIAGIFMVISAPWWGKRNDQHGFKQTLTIAFSGTGVAYALHMIVPGLFSLSILRAGLGFMRGGILHTLYSLTNHYAPPERQSGMMGIAASLTVLGNMIGPLAGGAIAGSFSLHWVLVVNSLLYLLTALFIWRNLREPVSDIIPAAKQPPET